MKLTFLCFLIIFTQTGWSQVENIINDIDKTFEVIETRNSLEINCLDHIKIKEFKTTNKACRSSYLKAKQLGLNPVKFLESQSLLKRVEEDLSI